MSPEPEGFGNIMKKKNRTRHIRCYAAAVILTLLCIVGVVSIDAHAEEKNESSEIVEESSETSGVIEESSEQSEPEEESSEPSKPDEESSQPSGEEGETSESSDPVDPDPMDPDPPVEPKVFRFESSSITVKLGDQLKLPMEVSPCYDSISYRTNHPDILSVDNDGVVTANAAGYATVTAKVSDGHYSKCVVRVIVPVTEVKMKYDVLKIFIGESRKLGTTIVPENATFRKLTWFSGKPSVATVSAGVVTGVSKGMSLVSVTTPEGKKGYTVVLVETPPSEVVVDEYRVFLTKGDEYQINATVHPDDAANKSLTYRSGVPDMVSVDENGKLNALRRGIAYVKAITVNKKTAVIRVKVYDPIESVTMAESLSMTVGDTAGLSPVIFPSLVLDRNLKWTSSNPDVAVAAGGKVTALSAGETTITVETYNGVTAECRVTVRDVPASVQLEPDSPVIGVGESISLKAAVLPADAYNEGFEFSSSAPEICTVSEDGVITGAAEGTAEITCRVYNGVSAVMPVTVKAAPTSLTLDSYSMNMNIGKTAKLSEKLAEGQASFSRVYTTSNSNVITVDEEGNITAVGNGTATVTVCTYNNVKASCRIRVDSMPKSISFDRESIELMAGDEIQLKTIMPEGTYAECSYISDHKFVCTIDSTGKVKAVGGGETTVRVVAQNGVSATCKVTVKPVASDIDFYNRNRVIVPGQRIKLEYYLPEGEYTRYVTFTSSDLRICTVSSDGYVKGVGYGNATVKVTTREGVYDVCRVTVTDDGRLLSQDPANGPAMYKRFKAIYQYPELPTGCEITALTMALNFLGYDVTKETMADDYLEKGNAWETDFREKFAGNPYSSYSYGCYAPVIVNSANSFLEDQGSSMRAEALDNMKFTDLFKFTDNGVPVILWATINLVPGYYTATWTATNGNTVTWYANEHCMVLVGHDDSAGTVFAADPDQGKVMEYDSQLFEKRYEELFRQAVVIR